MKTHKVSTMARKAFALLMVLALSAATVFALPLQTVGNTGDAKTYNSTYKAAQPTDISEGWVIRTFSTGLTLANEDIRFEFGANSLAKVIDLQDNIELYLLDGMVTAESETKAYTIKTPATSYQAQPGTILIVLSDSTNESGYVESGNAQASNSITKSVTDIMTGTYIDNSQSGFVPESTDSQSFMASAQSTTIIGGADAATEIVIVEVATTEPTPEPETEYATEPEAEDTTEPAAEPVYSAMVHTFSFQGFEATLEAYIGKAYIHYPTYVTAEEIAQAAAAAYAAYGSLLDGFYFSVVEPGLAEVTYPATYGPQEFAYAVELLNAELPYYLAQVLPSQSTAIDKADLIAAAEAADAQIYQALHAEFDFYGVHATLDAYIGKAYITYPVYVTEAEIAQAAAAAYAAYGSLLDGIYFRVLEPGLAEVTYPQSYGPQEFAYAVELLNTELPLYLAQILNIPAEDPQAAATVAQAEPAVETAVQAEPAADQAESVAEEGIEVEVATEAPEETQENTETLKTALETVSKEEAAAQVKKDNSFKFGANVSAAYGTHEGAYTAPSALGGRVGVYAKGARITVEPYMYSKTLTFGLRLSVNPFDLAGSLKLNFNGITNSVNTIMSYVSQFRFQKGNLTIKADRTSKLDFSSPYATELSSSFSKTENLLGTISFSTKGFSFYAFADDMQFAAKMSGRDQFMGAEASFSFKNLTVSASAAANVGQGLRTAMIHPAVEAQLSFNAKGTEIGLYAGIASRHEIQSIADLRAYLIEAKATVTRGIINVGVGAAFNAGEHFNGIMNNAPVTVVSAFKGDTLDVILSAGLKTEHLSIKAQSEVPFALTGSSRLAYNTVKTADGSTKTISADNFTILAELKLGKFTFQGGAAYEGLCGRLADTVKALIKGSGRRSAVVGLIDPQIATYFAKADFSTELFSIWARADYERVNGSLTLPVSVGLSVKF